jgi:hypothetical protein
MAMMEVSFQTVSTPFFRQLKLDFSNLHYYGYLVIPEVFC